jgi:hypothetical protein
LLFIDYFGLFVLYALINEHERWRLYSIVFYIGIPFIDRRAWPFYVYNTNQNVTVSQVITDPAENEFFGFRPDEP